VSMKNDTLRLGTKVQSSSVTGFNFNDLAGFRFAVILLILWSKFADYIAEPV
jgi:hypothetical protein